MSLSKNIKKLRESHGMSQEDFGRIAGVTGKAVSTWELGIKSPRMGAIEKLASYFGIPKSHIIDDEAAADTVSAAPAFIPPPGVKKIPVLGSISRRQPICAQENCAGYVNAPRNTGADVALRCKGNSMIHARILDGDLVFIHLQDTVNNGEIAAVLIGKEIVLRRAYLYADRAVFQSENPKYPPLVYVGAQMPEASIIGKAVALLGAIN